MDHDGRQTVAAQDDPAAGGEPRCGRFWLGDTGGRDVVVIVNRFGSVLDRSAPARQSHVGPAFGLGVHRVATVGGDSEGAGLTDSNTVSDWFYSEFPPKRFVDPLTGNEGSRNKQDEEVRQQLF